MAFWDSQAGAIKGKARAGGKRHACPRRWPADTRSSTFSTSSPSPKINTTFMTVNLQVIIRDKPDRSTSYCIMHASVLASDPAANPNTRTAGGRGRRRRAEAGGRPSSASHPSLGRATASFCPLLLSVRPLPLPPTPPHAHHGRYERARGLASKYAEWPHHQRRHSGPARWYSRRRRRQRRNHRVPAQASLFRRG
jgi:hypothetical protein